MHPKTPHQAVQRAIGTALPQVILEKSFPEIHRIADVVYPPKKIIYEIQYSPITLKEVQQRNRDYATLGYTVIWILHDRHFNRKILSP
ncbi:MAG: competence protein CoiA family protein, partial [Chlamydiota bacterium]